MECKRLRKVGKKTSYIPNIMIIHYVNTSSLNDMRVLNVYTVVINSNGENGYRNLMETSASLKGKCGKITLEND